MVIHCESCGYTGPCQIDGYAVGDRVLEGVRFLVVFRKKGTDAAVKVHPEDADYFATLNQKKWLKEVKEYALETDVVSCPKCGDDVGNPVFEAPKDIKPGKPFRILTIEDVMRDLTR